MESNQLLEFTKFSNQLNNEYERLHTAKEEAFWRSYMGLDNDVEASRKRMTETEIAWKDWLSSTSRLEQVRKHLEGLDTSNTSDLSNLKTVFQGWERTLEANTIPSEEARQISAKMIEQEGKLGVARGQMNSGYSMEGGAFRPASSIELSGILRTDSSEAKRKAAFEGLRAIEHHVLEHGLIDLIKLRNRFARSLGAEDFYAWKANVTEGMTKAEIFELLGALEAKTRSAAKQGVEILAQRQANKGPLQPWNAQYLISGDLAHQLDAYFPFQNSFRRWGECFSRMGVRYQNATLVLDLLDRKGKYENGFMHGPVPAWQKPDSFQPATIHFTTNAIPTQVGAGQRSLETFLHEGGHAAHFANIRMPSPCFAQEFAPTSIAFSEIQSMFFDNLMHDADWLRCYAKSKTGEPLPFELVEKRIHDEQPFSAWQCRLMLIVSFFEKELYELPEEELNAARILKIARRIETELSFMPAGSSRPLLSIPHLLSTESSAYYHGYVLAQMGVDQTRIALENKLGSLTNNDQVGPQLAANYWQPGNSRTTQEFLHQMTGQPLSEQALAERVNRSVDEALAIANKQFHETTSATATDAVRLDATITVIDGNETITSTENQEFEKAASEFESWIENRIQDS